jgi:hypothetical protein
MCLPTGRGFKEIQLPFATASVVVLAGKLTILFLPNVRPKKAIELDIVLGIENRHHQRLLPDSLPDPASF